MPLRRATGIVFQPYATYSRSRSAPGMAKGRSEAPRQLSQAARCRRQQEGQKRSCHYAIGCRRKARARRSARAAAGEGKGKLWQRQQTQKLLALLLSHSHWHCWLPGRSRRHFLDTSHCLSHTPLFTTRHSSLSQSVMLFSSSFIATHTTTAKAKVAHHAFLTPQAFLLQMSWMPSIQWSHTIYRLELFQPDFQNISLIMVCYFSLSFLLSPSALSSLQPRRLPYNR